MISAEVISFEFQKGKAEKSLVNNEILWSFFSEIILLIYLIRRKFDRRKMIFCSSLSLDFEWDIMDSNEINVFSFRHRLVVNEMNPSTDPKM